MWQDKRKGRKDRVWLNGRFQFFFLNLKNFHLWDCGRYGEYLRNHGVVHQKGNCYTLIKPRHPHLSLNSLCSQKLKSFPKQESSLSLARKMTKSGKTSASTKEQVAAPPPPISLVDYCNDDEQTTPQGSLNSQDLMSEAVNTTPEKLIFD